MVVKRWKEEMINGGRKRCGGACEGGKEREREQGLNACILICKSSKP